MKIKSVNNVQMLYVLGVELSSCRKISVFIYRIIPIRMHTMYLFNFSCMRASMSALYL